MHSDVAEVLHRHLGDQELIFVPNPGNAGDSLIAAGTFQFFQRHGIRFSVRRIDPGLFTGRVVAYGGGGNIVGPSTYGTRFLSSIHRLAKRVVILPHTIKGVDDLLANFGGNVDIFCREKVSYDYVRRTAPNSTVHLSHDMALGADVEALLQTKDTPPVRLRATLASVGAKIHLSKAMATQVGGLISLWTPPRPSSSNQQVRVLCAFRQDGERTGIELPPGNIDVSEVFSLGVESTEIASIAAHRLLGFLNQFEQIRTNRLHVAIASALLGKQVEMHDNNYYKCRAVYQHSLRAFPNVRFLEQPPGDR
jgi:exopolysaccharide biosynthesis predicted pyruvyltransferase EpsI